ncbi:hypothetical protein PM082_009599 [Marasmius tenuissimus]|nr:hypothetical protein PM082_009599 [Marasmius tenuissimus]
MISTKDGLWDLFMPNVVPFRPTSFFFFHFEMHPNSRGRIDAPAQKRFISQRPPQMPRADFGGANEGKSSQEKIFASFTSMMTVENPFTPPFTPTIHSLTGTISTYSTATSPKNTADTTRATSSTDLSQQTTAVDPPTSTTDSTQGQQTQTSPSSTPSFVETSLSRNTSPNSNTMPSKTYPVRPNATSRSISTTATTTSASPAPSNPPDSLRKGRIGPIAGLVVGLTILILLFLLLWWRRRKHNAQRLQEYTDIVTPRPLSLSFRPSEMDSKRSSMAKGTNDIVAMMAWDRNRSEDLTHSREGPDHESHDRRDYRLGPRRENSGTEASRSLTASPLSDTTDIEDMHVLRTQLNSVILRMARLETGEEAPPDYASSTGRST